MIDMLKRFFGSTSEEQDAGSPSSHDLKVATCALLVEMARIDEALTIQPRLHILLKLFDQRAMTFETACPAGSPWIIGVYNDWRRGVPEKHQPIAREAAAGRAKNNTVSIEKRIFALHVRMI